MNTSTSDTAAMTTSSAARPSLPRRHLALVVRREVEIRIRDKTMIVSTLITLLAIVAFAVLPALLDRPTKWSVAVVGAEATELTQRAKASVEDGDTKLRIRSFATRAAATVALQNGDVSAVVLGDRVIGKRSVSGRLLATLNGAAQTERVLIGARAAGISADAATKLATFAPLPVELLDPPTERQSENRALAQIVNLLLFVQIFGFGIAVASGVVEEKASRIVEILLARMSARTLLAGKVIGIGIVGLLQLAIFAAVGLTAAGMAGSLPVKGSSLITIAASLLWFLLGYALYSAVFAVAGSLAGRAEDLQGTTGPITLLVMLSYFASSYVAGSPGSRVGAMLSMLPPIAPFAMPSRIATGDAPLWQIAIAIVGVAGAAVLMISLAARVYERAALRSGQQKLRAILRAK